MCTFCLPRSPLVSLFSKIKLSHLGSSCGAHSAVRALTHSGAQNNQSAERDCNKIIDLPATECAATSLAQARATGARSAKITDLGDEMDA